MWAALVSLFHRVFGPSDPHRAFAEEVARVVRRRPEKPAVVVRHETFAIDVSVGGADAGTLFLANLYDRAKDLRGAPRDACIALFLDGLLQTHEKGWEAERGLLVPVLRGLTFGIQLPAKLLRRPFLPYVQALFAVDRPTTTSLVGEQRATEWGVSIDDVLAAADEGLFALDPPNVVRVDDAPGYVFSIEGPEGHAPSRLLLPGYLKSFERRIDGRPIAAIPDRTVLLIGGDADEDTVVWLQQKAKKIYEASTTGLSPALYTVAADDPTGRVVPYLPTAPDGVAVDVRIAHQVLAGSEHEWQKRHLEETLARDNRGIFVATYLVHATDEGRVYSAGTWTQTIPTYLPRTDDVRLVALDDNAAIAWVVIVPFEAVLHLLTPLEGLDPPRYETTGAFPSKDVALSLVGDRVQPPNEGRA